MIFKRYGISNTKTFSLKLFIIKCLYKVHEINLQKNVINYTVKFIKLKIKFYFYHLDLDKTMKYEENKLDANNRGGKNIH